MAGVAQLAPLVGVLAACAALGVPRASFYPASASAVRPQAAPTLAGALTPGEREAALSCLHEERSQDRAPAAV